MRVCDYVAERLASYGVKYVYGLMGGGASGLNDGFIQNKDIEYICFHHEQGAGYAAVGESKITNKILKKNTNITYLSNPFIIYNILLEKV